jgi:mannose-6-phosphate isomerase-like protein (cupin superfamily)
MANAGNITPEEYRRLESGNVDISVSFLHQIASAYGIELTALMFGDEPTMNAYFITRNGKGSVVERTKAYRYRSLAGGFSKRKADPFMVTVSPKPDDVPVYLNSHAGQEYNFVISGRLLLQINGKDLILEAGDSIYFNSELPHGMKALDGNDVKFLALII